MEAGVFALSRLHVRRQMRAGIASARLLHGWLESPENFLWTIFVGNTAVNFCILAVFCTSLFEAIPQNRLLLGVVYAAAVFLFCVLFDLLPKMLFRMFPTRLCLALAPVFRFIHMGLKPAVAVVEWGSSLLLDWRGGAVFKGHLFGNREEFRMVMQESGADFTTDERAMINRVLDLQSVTVQSITKPMADAVTITVRTPLSEAFALCRERGVTRLPVWDTRESRRRIAGLVDLDRVIYRADASPDRLAGEFLQPAVYLDGKLRLEEALRRLRRAGQMLGIVMQEDREVGVVSMQDILSQVFGEVKL
jgi:CBS domain containing-hemolysin-like protein